MNRHASLLILFALLLSLASGLKADEPLKVCATLPDLGKLAEQVGGDQVRVTVFVKGPQDAHFLEARPSFIKELNAADLLIISGLDLEIGWAPNLWANARNPRVLPGAAGHLDVSSAITPREIPAGVIDRSMGDVHPLGNPHYLLDPVNGLKAARAIRDRLVELRPESRDEFSKRYGAFANALQEALAGEKLAAKYDAEKLALLHEHGKLEDFLKSQGELDLLGGWLGRLAPFRGTEVIADHNLWPYFADRFGIKVVGFLEPKPGIAPSTSHLSQLVKDMKRRGVRAILTVPYFDRRHAAFLSRNTGAQVVSLAHQCGAQPGTDDYIAMIDHNVRQLEAALRPTASPPAKP